MSQSNIFATLANSRRICYRLNRQREVGPVSPAAVVIPTAQVPFSKNSFATSSVALATGFSRNFPLGQQQLCSNTTVNLFMASRFKCDVSSSGIDRDMEGRRKYYKCGEHFVTLQSIETWQQYWEKNKGQFKDVSDQPKSHAIVKRNLAEKVSMWRGDITRLEIDAIVNAANSRLMGGGGVDGAIHSAAGRKLKEECATLGGCEVGNAKITKGYDLPSRHVIHTVGPMVRRGSLNQEDLENCYINSLNLVAANNLRSVAFPCISTGVYGYPNEPAANVALSTVRAWLESKPNSIDRVIFCLFLPEDVKYYMKWINTYFPLNDD